MYTFIYAVNVLIAVLKIKMEILIFSVHDMLLE
jgi:hypothetical protein